MADATEASEDPSTLATRREDAKYVLVSHHLFTRRIYIVARPHIKCNSTDYTIDFVRLASVT